MANRYDIFREQMTASNDRFQAAMLQALHAHTETMASMSQLLHEVSVQEAHLNESIEELKQLVMSQGAEMRDQRLELRALRERLNGGST